MIELVIVMAMLGLLLSLALPQYMATLERGREQVLQSNLAALREAIDKFHGDRGRYPDTLEDLVTQRYLRELEADPRLMHVALTTQQSERDTPGQPLRFVIQAGWRTTASAAKEVS